MSDAERGGEDEADGDEGASGAPAVVPRPTPAERVSPKGWVDHDPNPGREGGASVHTSPYGNSSRMGQALQRLSRLEHLKLEMEKNSPLSDTSSGSGSRLAVFDTFFPGPPVLHKYALDTDNTYVEEDMRDEPEPVPPSQPTPVNRRLFEDEDEAAPAVADAAAAPAGSAEASEAHRVPPAPHVLDLVTPVKTEKEPDVASRPVARPLLKLKQTLAASAKHKRELGLIDRKPKKAKISESDEEPEGEPRRTSMLIFPVPEFQPGYRPEDDEGHDSEAEDGKPSKEALEFIDRRTQLRLNPEKKAKAKATAKTMKSAGHDKAKAKKKDDLDGVAPGVDGDGVAPGVDGAVASSENKASVGKGKGKGKKKGAGKGKKTGKGKRPLESKGGDADDDEEACSAVDDTDGDASENDEAASAAAKPKPAAKGKATAKAKGKAKAKAKARAVPSHDVAKEEREEGMARKRLVSYPSVKEPSEVMDLLQGEDMMMRVVIDMIAAADQEESEGPPTVKTLPRYTYFNLSVYWTRSAIGLIRRNPKPPHTYIGTLSSAKLDMMSVAIESISHMVAWLGGDGPELRYALDSDECVRMKVMLNDCAKYAFILRSHMKATGKSLEEI
ncbi:lmbrd1 [Symbiodinium microadriaticum]|nr:lmbrd1 [Symbiodinium microadriaticum]CAE7405992.1 lmbrd1 [Symbiodinium sp. KB8]